MGKVLIIKGADFSEVSVGKSYATETEEMIANAIEQDNINLLLNESGSLNDGVPVTANGYYRSPYIPIDELKDIVFYGQNYATLGAVYNSNKEFISTITGIQYARFASVHFNDIKSDVVGAAYVRLVTLEAIGELLRTTVSDDSAYIGFMSGKVASLGVGDITSLCKTNVMITSTHDYAYTTNQKSTLLIPLSSLTGKTITNNGTYSSSVAPFNLYKSNMQSVDYSESVTTNVPISVSVDTLISTYPNAAYIAMCVDIRATNPTIVISQ